MQHAAPNLQPVTPAGTGPQNPAVFQNPGMGMGMGMMGPNFYQPNFQQQGFGMPPNFQQQQPGTSVGVGLRMSDSPNRQVKVLKPRVLISSCYFKSI
jgi:hypothetical protein